MMRRFACLATLLLAALARPDTEFMGMFVQGKRIGVMTSTRTTHPDGTVHSLGETKIGANVLGQGMQMSMSTDSVSKNGRLAKQTIKMETGGRSQTVTAIFGETIVDVVKQANGQTTKKQIDIPAGAVLVEDPTFGFVGKGLPEVGTTQTFYVFDPTVLSLIKNDAEFLGKKQIVSDGLKYEGHLLRVKDPRATSDVYLDDDGTVILAIGVFGITLRPITKEEALGTKSYAKSVDLATLSRIATNKPISTPAKIKSLTLQITGANLGNVRTDGYWQTAKRNAKGLSVTITPPTPKHDVSLANLKKTQPNYLKPALYLPTTDPEMIRIAKRETSHARNGYDAALRICKYVSKLIKPDTTIGMLRDAKEVLKTKVGVCRDYSVLAATLMRSVGIPTKVVTGIVYAGDAFYYHAWVEAWDGHGWIGLDPTLNGGPADATHIKFTEGDPEAAFVSFVLDGAKISVLSERR